MSTETVHHTALTLADHLPALQVLVPFIAAPLIVLFGRRGIAWPIALASSATAFAVSILLLSRVIDGSVISYHMGGWEPPLGIEYRVDAANAFVLLLVSAMSTLVLLFARESVEAEVSARHHALFYSAYLLCLSGLLGVAITGDAFNVFVFLEISSLATYVLIAQGSERDKRALTASYDYLIMGTIGATFFVIGIGFLYMATGTLNMADIADRISEQGSNRTIRAGFAFIVVGVGLKVAMYPLHSWLPNAYTYAPSMVTAFLAATATKVAIYVLLRFVFTVFDPGFLFEFNTLGYIILPLAIVAMFAASFIAVFQSDFKRMLAYSSVGQIGYILLGIAMLSQTGLTAAIVHLFNHGITKAALFMAVGAFVLTAKGSFYNDIQGLGRRMPLTSAAVVVGGLSLIGVPGTAGFVSKWLLVEAALENGWWPVALLVVASSLLAVIYVWRVLEVLYMQPTPDGSTVQEAPMSMLAPMWIAALACVYFGLDTDVTLTAAATAAEGLLAGSTGLQ
ncbi:monovalent cation/H+ antiporter subunit D family protein [Sedimentitalea sp. JM2-8]|uniref:Monovalent cation/H+ antiporter subunit D family protein n=1 Tax=Sedimentitalea xiamensis TaxID=3050037 RepID=A0ABT7FJD3_9RHOB|nr:monovalent cation/H+ antiporter subunit D family protein [Sedimentitalea xiamensis]MDK3074894.1 monovalent cation/H+ antiporter subunit D family protein [Sedimentitalea xiamensis]